MEKTNKRPIRITVGVPSSSELLHRRFVQSLMHLQYPEGSQINFAAVYGYQLPFARNRIVQEMLDFESDYLLFIDADMEFPPDVLIRLLSHNLDIVNALAFKRIKPHYPCIFKWNKKEGSYETCQYSGGLLEVDATGMPCILIKSEVFKKVAEDNPGLPWYYYRDHLFSSDLTFCENARKSGFKVMIDTDLKIGHIGEEIVVDEQYYLNHLDPEAKAKHNRGIREFLTMRADFKENLPPRKKK